MTKEKKSEAIEKKEEQKAPASTAKEESKKVAGEDKGKAEESKKNNSNKIKNHQRRQYYLPNLSKIISPNWVVVEQVRMKRAVTLATHPSAYIVHRVLSRTAESVAVTVLNSLF